MSNLKEAAKNFLALFNKPIIIIGMPAIRSFEVSPLVSDQNKSILEECSTPSYKNSLGRLAQSWNLGKGKRSQAYGKVSGSTIEKDSISQAETSKLDNSMQNSDFLLDEVNEETKGKNDGAGITTSMEQLMDDCKSLHHGEEPVVQDSQISDGSSFEVAQNSSGSWYIRSRTGNKNYQMAEPDSDRGSSRTESSTFDAAPFGEPGAYRKSLDFSSKEFGSWLANASHHEGENLFNIDYEFECTCNGGCGSSFDPEYFKSGLEAYFSRGSVVKDEDYVNGLQEQHDINQNDFLMNNKDSGDRNENHISRIEELQLDLLECALEYEVKILEMKMKMVQMKSQNGTPYRISEINSEHLKLGDEQELGIPLTSGSPERKESQRLDVYRRKLSRIQVQKESLVKELGQFKKRERKFELQKRNLEDAMRRVNCLKRQLTKKEEENVECQLREKEAKARLHEVQVALQRSKARNFEPAKLVKLIPALRSWLRSLKKTTPVKSNQRQLVQVEQFDAVLGRILESAPPGMLTKEGQMGHSRLATDKSDSKRQHSTPVDCIKEVYALQKELQRLADGRS